MTIEDRAFELLREALPGLNEGQYRIIKETSHPLWEEAVKIATKEDEDWAFLTKRWEQL
jgi:hypothetical protein